MSLPSYVTFVKDCEIVGKCFCNIGWGVSSGALYNLVKHVEIDVTHTMDIINNSPEDKYATKMKRYFTTAEDLEGYEYIIVYSFIIPRDVIKDVMSGKITSEEWNKDLFYRLRVLDDETRLVFKEYHDAAEKRVSE